MMKYKLKLRQHEFETLLLIFQNAVLPDIQQASTIQDKLSAVLLLQMYECLRKGDGLFKKEKYSFQIPVACAMAFYIYWRCTPMAGIMLSQLINRIIGEIDRQFA